MTTIRNGLLKFAAIAAIGGLPSAVLADGAYEIKNIDDLKFAPMEGSPIEMSLLWGDPTSGPSGFLIKVPAGFEAPIHAHTSDYRAFIIEGSALHWLDGETRDMAEPVVKGGYWLQPGGEFHGDANSGDGTALSLIIFDGPFDFLMPE